ncbi:ABC transporter substrate-binding protein [Aureimonas leprariae]|uniref:ABC transporter substrate-binding protein n=1 Tax=Plantimonas leprariae TaxID=2615207 RepID=A0A7V7TVJ4_9HYPH|nr:ABC transporter substrate-binding protein [Aureimonas leprariae]KAB0677704.1 ABC transporter substrate-binding protein [Aureimonas leprariae]
MSGGRGITRRGFVAGAAAALAAPDPSAAAATVSRAAVVDWALVETSLALEVAPLAAVELVLYRRLVVEPAVPAGVIDLGLRGSIDFELLASTRPDRIYRSNFSAWAAAQLERIAPVRDLTIFRRGEKPFARAEEAMRAMAADYGVPARAEAYIAATATELLRLSRALERWTDRPVLIANLGDARHFRTFGEDSMFGEVAARLGFRNAWGPRTSYSATAPVGIEALAGMPEAIVVLVGPIPPEARQALPASALWQAMPQVAAGRVLTIDPVNAFGGLPAGRRFARLFAEALERRA